MALSSNKKEIYILSICVLYFSKVWVLTVFLKCFIPFVLGRKQKSEILEPLQSRAGQWRMVHPDCGSELWCRLQMTSRLREFKQNPIGSTFLGTASHLWIQKRLFSPVSPQRGKYSSCWMSSISSRPFPIPPLVVMRGGRPSSPALKV